MYATRTDTVRARIAPELKNSVEEIFASLGMNSSQAIVLFFKQVELHNGLPFDVKLPPKPILNMASRVRSWRSSATTSSSTIKPGAI